MTTSQDPAPPLDPDEIRRALEELRPDPAAFREGVERRIAERKAREEDQETRFAAAPARLRWAASILPPGVVGGVASGGIVAAKKLGVKAVPGLMAIPAVALVMVVLTFFGAFRSLRRIGGPEQERLASVKEARRAWWRRNWIPAALGLALLATLILLRHAEAATFFILFSMAALVLSIGLLARRGFSTRNRVGFHCAMLLYAVLIWGCLLGFVGRPDLRNDELGVLVFCAFVVGIGVCVWLTGVVTRPVSENLALLLETHRGRPYQAPDPLTGFILRTAQRLASGLLVLVVLAASALFLVLGVARLLIPGASREGLVEWVESFEKPVEESKNWDRFGRVATYLLDDGGRQPELSLAREELRRAIASGEKLSRAAVGVAARLGFLTDDELAEQVASAFEVRPLRWYGTLCLAEKTVDLDPGTSRSGAVAVRAQIIDLWPVMADPGEARLLDTWDAGPDVNAPATVQELLELTTISGRTGLVERLEEEWPKPRYQYALVTMGYRVDLFDRFGRADLVDRRREEIHEALRLPWRGTAYWVWRARTTSSAVELLARCGIPDGVDPEDLRAAVSPSVLEWTQDLYSPRFEAHGILNQLARVQLDAIAPRSPGGCFGVVIRYRFLLGVLFLVALCILATARAPRREDEV